MGKKKICLIAQFPPPIHGLSEAAETIRSSRLREKYDLRTVDLSRHKDIFNAIRSVAQSDADLFYLTISQSVAGNIRDLLILSILELRHRKTVIHLHGGYYRTLVDQQMNGIQRWLNYKVVSRLEGAIVLSESLMPIFRGMLPERRISVIGNCVKDEYVLSENDWLEKKGMLKTKGIRHVLFLSNMMRAKGYRDVLKLACIESERRKRGEDPVFHYDFAGAFFEKEEEDYFRSFIKNNDLQNCVSYHGMVEGDRKRALLKKCKIFILLTRYPKEGQPISILEAMANGMAVVATDHAGIPDVIQDGNNGILVRKGETDLKRVDTRMQELQLERIGERNRRIAVMKYSEHRYIDSLDRLFEGIMQ